MKSTENVYFEKINSHLNVKIFEKQEVLNLEINNDSSIFRKENIMIFTNQALKNKDPYI